MTILSGNTIRRLGIVHPCLNRSEAQGLTYGLGPAGYDVRLDFGDGCSVKSLYKGDFLLAATVERFIMPNNVLGVVHDKSTWARRGLAVQNTVIEPGWRGYLTIELSYHGDEALSVAQDVSIAQVVFHFMDTPAQNPYDGKYQDQEAGPQGARL